MKTYRNCMEPGENLDWCRPYIDKTGSYYAVLCEGKIISLKTPYLATSDFTPEQLKEFAQSVNPDYADYDGWDDTHIILEAMDETGCTECPFCDECEAMDEPYGPDEE